MAQESTPDFSEIPTKELVDVTVMGSAVMRLVNLGLENDPTFHDDAQRGYYDFIKAGKTHWAHGAPITGLDRSNHAAADIIWRLPAYMTLQPLEPSEYGSKPLSALTADADNLWAGPTFDVLVETGLYVQADEPSPALKMAAPALDVLYGRGSHYGQPDYTAARDLLPADMGFKLLFKSSLEKASGYINTIPNIVRETMDPAAIAEAIENFDPSSTAPATPEGNSWDLQDVTRGIPVHRETVIRYAELSVGIAAEYLAHLLRDMELLHEALRA